MSVIVKILTSFILLIFLYGNVKAKNIALLGAYNPPNHELLDIEIVGDYAYVPGGLGGLNILDVSNPAMPVAVASYQIAECNWGRTYAWTVDGSYAYGCGRECGIWILDVSIHTVDFPHVDTGSCQDTTLTLTNNGGTDLLFSTPNVVHPDFTLTLPTSVLQPGESTDATLTYCANAADGWGTLLLEQSDPDEPLVPIDLRGNSPWGVEAGEPAPDFTLSSVNGFGEITLSELQGQPVVSPSLCCGDRSVVRSLRTSRSTYGVSIKPQGLWFSASQIRASRNSRCLLKIKASHFPCSTMTEVSTMITAFREASHPIHVISSWMGRGSCGTPARNTTPVP